MNEIKKEFYFNITILLLLLVLSSLFLFIFIVNIRQSVENESPCVINEAGICKDIIITDYSYSDRMRTTIVGGN